MSYKHPEFFFKANAYIKLLGFAMFLPQHCNYSQVNSAQGFQTIRSEESTECNLFSNDIVVKASLSLAACVEIHGLK